MTPVVYLSDAFLATGSEPWRDPGLADLPDIARRRTRPSRRRFRPYERDPDTLARPWAVPGTPGLEHRIGGLEKADITGNVSYDPDNHHRMQTAPRRRRSPASPTTSRRSRSSGRERGELLILGWGSTYGAIRIAVERLQARRPGASPTPTCATSTRSRRTPRTCSARYRRVLVPEINLGQLLMLIRARYLVDAVGYNRVRGKPFRIAEIVDEAERILAENRMTETNGQTTGAAAPPAGAQPRERRGHPADPQGLRVRPGGPLVPGLRRLLDPRPDPEGDARLRLPDARTSCSSPASAAPAGCRTT